MTTAHRYLPVGTARLRNSLTCVRGSELRFSRRLCARNRAAGVRQRIPSGTRRRTRRRAAAARLFNHAPRRLSRRRRRLPPRRWRQGVVPAVVPPGISGRIQRIVQPRGADISSGPDLPRHWPLLLAGRAGGLPRRRGGRTKGRSRPQPLRSGPVGPVPLRRSRLQQPVRAQGCVRARISRRIPAGIRAGVQAVLAFLNRERFVNGINARLADGCRALLSRWRYIVRRVSLFSTFGPAASHLS